MFHVPHVARGGGTVQNIGRIGALALASTGMLSLSSRGSSPTRGNYPKLPFSREISRVVEADDNNESAKEALVRKDAEPMASTSTYDPETACLHPALSGYNFLTADPAEHVRSIFERLFGGSENQKTVPLILDYLDKTSTVDNYCQIVQRLSEGGLEYCLSRLMDKWDQVFTDETSQNDAEIEVFSVIRLLWTMSPYATVLRRIAGLKEDLFPLFNELLQRGQQILKRVSQDNERLRQVILFEQATMSLLQNCLLVAGKQEDVSMILELGLVETIIHVLRRSRNRTTGEACIKCILFVTEYGPLSAMVTLRDCYVIRAMMKFWDSMLHDTRTTSSSRPVAPTGSMIARIAQLIGQPEMVHCSLVATLPREKRLTLRCREFKMSSWCSNTECGQGQKDVTERFKVCSLCKICRYCCEDCQKLHWDAGHRQECFQIGTLPRHFTCATFMEEDEVDDDDDDDDDDEDDDDDGDEEGGGKGKGEEKGGVDDVVDAGEDDEKEDDNKV